MESNSRAPTLEKDIKRCQQYPYKCHWLPAYKTFGDIEIERQSLYCVSSTLDLQIFAASDLKSTTTWLPTTRECVYLVRRGRFRSRDKDGGHTIQFAIAEKRMLHANFSELLIIFVHYNHGRSKNKINNKCNWNVNKYTDDKLLQPIPTVKS